MNLEILSLEEALNYVPLNKTYMLRILNEFGHSFIPSLKGENFIEERRYYFDDLWPKNWKEYSWVKNEDWNKMLEIERKNYPKMTKESLIDYYESRGHPYRGCTLFDPKKAKKILSDFDKFKNEVDTIVVHCIRGKNRSPAIGIAMNEIYGWEIEGLKKKFPNYRRFIYEIMIDVSKTR